MRTSTTAFTNPHSISIAPLKISNSISTTIAGDITEWIGLSGRQGLSNLSAEEEKKQANFRAQAGELRINPASTPYQMAER